jgi:hypothetical protein
MPDFKMGDIFSGNEIDLFIPWNKYFFKVLEFQLLFFTDSLSDNLRIKKKAPCLNSWG